MVERFGWRFQMGDKVIQTRTTTTRCFQRDIGTIERIDPSSMSHHPLRRAQGKVRLWRLDEVSLAYAVTIHKSQGSEFQPW